MPKRDADNVSNIVQASQFALSTAQSKYGPWTTKPSSWEAVLRRFEDVNHVHKIPYTGTQYALLDKSAREQAKHCGGYLLGALKGDTRKANDVLFRSAIALDTDKQNTTWKHLFERLAGSLGEAGYEYFVYPSASDGMGGTVSGRILLPLTHNIPPEQYAPVCRYVMELIGIDDFDTTAAQANRFFYLPAMVSNAVWRSKRFKGEPVDADAILEVIGDWEDPANWAQSSDERENGGVRGFSGGDEGYEGVEEMAGEMGSVCRALTIHDVIAQYLPDVWTPGEGDDYTYCEGTSVNGGKVFDNHFFYSFHDSDPHKLQVLNAFELVQRHTFGDTSRESYRRALLLFGKNEAVIKQRASDIKLSYEVGIDGFGAVKGYNTESEHTTTEWDALFDEPDPVQTTEHTGVPRGDEIDKRRRGIKAIEDQRGDVKSLLNNVFFALDRMPSLIGAFRFNALTNRVHQVQDTDTQGYSEAVEDRINGKPMGESDYMSISLALTAWYQKALPTSTPPEFSQSMIRMAVDRVAGFAPYSPVEQWLGSLEWDGVPRVATLFSDVLGVPGTEYAHGLALLMMKAAVARALEPGVKFDNVFVLVGPEGTRKSTFCRLLCPSETWFCDSMPPIQGQGRDAVEAMAGAWIVEMPELTSMSFSERNVVKAFLSRSTDKTRLAYRRDSGEYPRACIFIATTNQQEFLVGTDGNRRYLPIQIDGQIDTELLVSTRDQLWAEAVQLYRASPSLAMGPDLEKLAAIARAENYVQHEHIRPEIEQYLEGNSTPGDWVRGGGTVGFDEGFNDDETGERRCVVCVDELIENALGVDTKGRNTNRLRKEIEEVMKHQKGWRRGVAQAGTQKRVCHPSKIGTPTQRRFKGYGKMRMWWTSE